MKNDDQKLTLVTRLVILLLVFAAGLLIASCSHAPLTKHERQQFEECKKENEELRKLLLECSDSIDELSYAKKCWEEGLPWFELGCS